ncbi:hypothetical protein F4703DRAFT_1791763 [Phycomyces blakesleeanus]|uniref:G-protein coupled receptors family 2 profile 2 domain-containing protein n=1 Tax=Phycomyces blakesleeanus (strain ATCC 8743b / DSM 1359 / FGSC 10004 / NBRC 33097 / NRRL 1555) TaxID=763407 RepID=A0A167NPB8_PHYB8|nr:hypothetical protein PHYBLDRAFT_59924 [Phycomyces blakesleeanus NRRL 1555(-)]OAD76388.1 hypothetical protein PHYBLDRAFT_59924 [Phycomyces blakesleeanus NRRL 1555(-)]|eukprot:XP_018294428.1 hypothetical protein PHYBLDRAFT_59924 [Phycomyces blakesleeanus NRRL 1555(-)]
MPTCNSAAAAAAVSVSNDSACTKYPGGVCSEYIDYPVYLGSKSFADIEHQLAILPNFTLWYSKIVPGCTDAFNRYHCSLAYPKCETDSSNTPTIYLACKSTCEKTVDSCTNVLMTSGAMHLLPNCTSEMPVPGTPLQPDETCNIIEPLVSGAAAGFNISAIPLDFLSVECPAPFTLDLAPEKHRGIEYINYCQYGCCIPCPSQDLFYKKNWTRTAFLATDIMRFISAIASFVILISYLVLPDKRRHPSLLILNLSLAIFLFSMTVFFSIGDQHGLQCADDITPSDQKNNYKCAAQGAILIFSSFATTCWAAALIVNLHLHTVWNSSFFTNRYILLNVICWGIPTVIMCTALGIKSVKFEFANLCLVSIEHIFALFFYPMAVIICPSFLLHIATFFYIAKIAIREGLESDMSQSLSNGDPTGMRPAKAKRHKHVITAVKIQWRALILAIAACGTVVFYWLFYMTQISNLLNFSKNVTVASKWLTCMLESAGDHQNECTSIVSPYLPTFGLMVTAESLVSLVGIWLFIIFGKRSLWREWNDMIFELRIRFSSRGRSEKNGEQFFAL